MDILDNEITNLFNAIFSDEYKENIELNEEFDKTSSNQLFSLITEKSIEEDTSLKYIETSISISSNDYLFSHKNILKIINE